MHMGPIAVTPTGSAALFTHGTFIDAIILSLSTNGEDVVHVKRFLNAYSVVSRQQQSPDDLINYYINTIHKIIESGVNVLAADALASLSLRMSADAMQYPILADIADQIKRLYQDASSHTLTSITLADARRRVCSAIHANELLKENAKQRALIMSFGETGRDSDLLQIEETAQKISSVVLSTRQSATAETSIDSRNPDSLINAFTRVEEQFTSNVFKSGIQAINNFMGSVKGLLLGTTTIFAARSHNFKSGMLNKIPVWAVRYNTPPELMDGTQHCVVIISLENNADVVVRDICDDLYIDMYREPVPDSWTNEQKAHFIIGEFAKKNVVLLIERFLPDVFGADDYISYMEGLKASGLTPWIVALDYLAKLKLNPLLRTNEGLAEVASRLCNHAKSYNYLLASGHQLNREATSAIQMRANQAKYFTEGMMADSSGVFREVDNVFFINIEKNDRGIVCLGMKWHKARYIKDVYETHKYSALPFLGKELGLVNDAFDEPLHSHDVNNIVFPDWFVDKFPDYAYGSANTSSMMMGDMAML